MGPIDVRAVSGDPAAFEALYRANVEAIQRFFARRLDDPYRVADLTAEVFVAALESAATYRPELGSARAWLYGIGRMLLIDDWRDRAREGRALQRISTRDLLDSDDLARVHERIDAAAQARALYAALRDLPEGERSVLELVALDGLKIVEAAKVLSITPTSARARLHRARKTLTPTPDLRPLGALS
jgi:RNA polymerase sigma-70 factor (ECF subfamily)